MTRQMADTVRFDDEAWNLIAASGRGLFHPCRHGLETCPPHTALWRGFRTTYAAGARLRVVRLEVGLPHHLDAAARAGEGPWLDNCRPIRELVWVTPFQWDPDTGRLEEAPPIQQESTAWVYPDLGLPSRYSGRLLIGRSYDPSLDPDFAVPDIAAFREAVELYCERGAIIEVRDRSAALTRLRSRGGPLSARRILWTTAELFGAYPWLG